MGERAESNFNLFDERFETLRIVQEALARRGFFLHPVEKELTEALVTGPLLHRLRTLITKRGFGKVAGHVAITFSGYSQDAREVYAIPEARAYWQALDHQLPELPALLAILPAFGYNGPGMQLSMLGDIDAELHRPAQGRYDLHVADAGRLIDDAVRRIQQAGRKYHLPAPVVEQLVAEFRRGAGPMD